MGRSYYRAALTFRCALLALWIYLGISGYHSGNWGEVGAAAFWIALLWVWIWEDYDESREDHDANS